MLEGGTPRFLDPRTLVLYPPLFRLALERRLDGWGRLRTEHQAGLERRGHYQCLRRGSDSAPLRRALEKLGRAVGKEAAGDGGPGALLASHPSIRRRIADLERFDQGPP